MDGRKHDGFLTEMHTIMGYMQEACNSDFLEIEFVVRVLIFAKSLIVDQSLRTKPEGLRLKFNSQAGIGISQRYYFLKNVV